jgi:phosphate transport system substrate-binding protein
LSTFINYFLCAGQQKADILGYSPLPKNLVQAGFDQVKKIPGAVASPSISKCDNPALHILQTAPKPSPCMKLGATCGGATPGTTTGGSTSTGGSGGTSTGASGGTSGGNNGAGPTSSAVDPLTGAPANGGTTTTDGTVLAAAQAQPVVVSGDRDGTRKAVAWIAALALLLTVLTPPLVVRRFGKR